MEVRVAGVLVEIQTEHLLKMSVLHYQDKSEETGMEHCMRESECFCKR
jgi:hypothetical protein